MQLGFFISGVAGQMAQNKLDNISHNLANVNTTGYLEDRTAFSSQFSNAIAQEGSPEHVSAAYLSLNSQYVSTQAGAIRHSGGNFDFAISGDGYFRVQLADGSEGLTRAGNFKVDADGNLLTQGNLPVLDNGGAPITLPVGDVSATGNGTIYVNEQPAADLGIAMISDDRLIEKVEGVVIRTPETNITEPDGSVSVLHNSLEESNVNSILAMAQLVDTMREYQSIMKVVEQYNQQAGLLNDRVGVIAG